MKQEYDVASSSPQSFDATFCYKVIYVISMPYEDHKGLLKIGEATLKTSLPPQELVPGCKELNQAAKARIKGYIGTASVSYSLLYTELACRPVTGGFLTPFSDKNVHSVLLNSRIHKVRPNKETGDEWFETNLETVKAAIKAVKEGKSSLNSSEIHQEDTPKPIEFREEQIDAIEKTIKAFKKNHEMLWYAKMRFGKTLTALEVVRRSQYRRVIIVTHRPVVNDSWGTDFKKIFYPGNSAHPYQYEDKTKDSYYTVDEKTDAENDLKIRKLDNDGTYFLYFASIQDLRGSQIVKGKFNKNNAVFALDWDLIIIDEAHEGTQTELGDNVIKALRKKETRVLALSGTPFNLLSQYSEDNVYTWDYVMEQKKKDEWDLTHHGDHNPYADLPKMHIFTYDLGEKLKKYVFDEYDTKAFNFREFFRVWYKGPNGKRQIPANAVEGNFIHENDVKSFLDLMVKDDPESIYPFSTSEYREMFRHTLWMVPGVKEANALEGLLRLHPIFSKFGIANVAGLGDTYEKEFSNDALEKVRNIIRNNAYSITLSCGKLTTGVTVPEWTAAIMLSGSYSTAAAQYMQTIFRVQSAGSINGKQKTDCYVFDFAPDRTLKVLTETVHLSRKPGKSDTKRREAMTEFLNYCPVIAVSGSHMKSYSVNSMMEQVKQIYAERAVNSGFEDESIYNDELLKLDNIDASRFNALKDIIGRTKAEKKKDSVIVNGQGLTDEQLQHIDDDDDGKDTTSTQLTPEQIAEKLAKKQAREARKKAIDILRGISIRMPLLIYGADVPIDEDIDLDRFVAMVDDTSWAEFMPAGVTKEVFADFTKYYDRDVFIAAGKRIRKLAAAADKETPTNRVKLIAEIFRHFRNPDKETVLTPWRVVNMHMADTLGGWCFFNEQFEEDTSEEKHRLEQPRFVEQDGITNTVFGENTKILEINSKTGLYPLYIAYSCYRQRLEDTVDEDWEPEILEEFWTEVITENIYVICKTPMAKSITRRTLSGYSGAPVNAHYFDELINQLKNKPEQFRQKILKGSYWGKEVKEMKFDAVVGNPPYQTENQGDGTGKDPIYHIFIDNGRAICNRGTFIHPGRFLFDAGKTPKSWNEKMLHDKHYKIVKYFPDSSAVFPTVDIKGGVAITYWDEEKDFGEIGTFYLHSEMASIMQKIASIPADPFSDLVYAMDLYRITEEVYKENKWAEGRQSKGHRYALGSNVFDIFPELFFDTKPENSEEYIQVLGIQNSRRVYKWVKKKYIQLPKNFDSYRVFIPKVNGSGEFGDILTNPQVQPPQIGHTATFLCIGNFKTDFEANATLKYLKSKFLRLALSSLKVTHDNPKPVWRNIPQQDFTPHSDIDWTRSVSEIDQLLYHKYSLTEEEIAFIEKHVKPMDGSSIYEKMLKSSYKEIVKFLLKKYGPCKHDYYKDKECTIKNQLISRTAEGLYCHHIDEDKAIMLSEDKHAAENPIEYQKKDRLVYCNLLEHLILHVKIAEEPRNPDANQEMVGIGGAINYIVKQLNDIYGGKEFAEEWRNKCAKQVIDQFDDYIAALEHLWSVIEKHPVYQILTPSREDLCKGYDGKIVERVYNTFCQQ